LPIVGQPADCGSDSFAKASSSNLIQHQRRLPALMTSVGVPGLRSEDPLGILEMRGTVGRAKYIKPRASPTNAFTVASSPADLRGTSGISGAPIRRTMSAPSLRAAGAHSSAQKNSLSPQAPMKKGLFAKTRSNGLGVTGHTPRRVPGTPAGIDQTVLNTVIPHSGFPSHGYLRGL
jgi:hypothetical protein